MSPSVPTSFRCPDPEQGETAEDCPWAGIARELGAEADAGRPLAPLLEARVPRLVHDLGQDARYPALLGAWGRSLNFDENMKQVIIHPAVLQAVGQLAGVAFLPLVGHAGLTHTYGYLFSLLRTSYGYKRKRWVDGAIARGFRLPAGSLGPEPGRGTLLSNVTWFIAQVAFRDQPEALAALREARLELVPDVRDFSFSRLALQRVEERGWVATLDHPPREVCLRTDYVPFLSASEGGDSHLLIYSVVDPLDGGARLITAFPTAASAVAKALDAAKMGEAVPIATQFNAYVEGLTHLGSRRVV